MYTNTHVLNVHCIYYKRHAYFGNASIFTSHSLGSQRKQSFVAPWTVIKNATQQQPHNLWQPARYLAPSTNQPSAVVTNGSSPYTLGCCTQTCIGRQQRAHARQRTASPTPKEKEVHQRPNENNKQKTSKVLTTTCRYTFSKARGTALSIFISIHLVSLTMHLICSFFTRLKDMKTALDTAQNEWTGTRQRNGPASRTAYMAIKINQQKTKHSKERFF